MFVILSKGYAESHARIVSEAIRKRPDLRLGLDGHDAAQRRRLTIQRLF